MHSVAVRAAAGASPVERALIDALAHRYQGVEALDPLGEAPLLIAYAEGAHADITLVSSAF